MKRLDKREEDRLRTRTAILDATEAVMREEGYAAVTSRRVAERAGLKSQLIHYHFGSMDDLFQELFRRNDKLHFTMHLKALTSPQPIGALWNIVNNDRGMDTVTEFVSAARHRKVLKDELVETRRRFRMLHTVTIENYFEKNGIDNPPLSPTALALLLASVTTLLIEERGLGMNDGHDEIMDFVEKLIATLQSSGTGDVGESEGRSPKRAPRS